MYQSASSYIIHLVHNLNTFYRETYDRRKTLIISIALRIFKVIVELFDNRIESSFRKRKLFSVSFFKNQDNYSFLFYFLFRCIILRSQKNEVNLQLIEIERARHLEFYFSCFYIRVPNFNKEKNQMSYTY